jgi:hypothetical protein
MTPKRPRDLNALTKLKRRGDVVQVGNGRWALASHGDSAGPEAKLSLVAEGESGRSP